MADANDLAKQFSPDHLKSQIPGEEEDLKKQVEESPKVSPPPPDPKEDPKAHKEYTFQLNWRSPSGKLWLGEFTNKILTIADRQAVGMTRAKFSGGMPIESLDGLTVEINLMVAHLIFSLVKKPEWADNLRTLSDIGLLQEIYGEVASHEAVFRGLKTPEAGSEE